MGKNTENTLTEMTLKPKQEAKERLQKKRAELRKNLTRHFQKRWI